MSKPLHIQAGDRFHNLVAVEPAESDSRRRVRWVFLCDCGGKTTTTVSKVYHGYTKSCGCRAKYIILRNAKGVLVRAEGKPEWEYLARIRWNECYSDGCPFELFVQLSQEPCHYCGRSRVSCAKQNKLSWSYNGLDRLDPTLDHSPSNIVTCCWDCNTAKMGRTYQEYIDWLRLSCRHLSLSDGCY
jgi:hypothetical protein